MRLGTVISALGHAGIVLLAVFADFEGASYPEPEDTVSSVAIFSQEEFEALLNEDAAADEVADEPDEIQQPEVELHEVESIAAESPESQLTADMPQPPEVTDLEVPEDEREVVSISREADDSFEDEPSRQAAPKVSDEATLEVESESKPADEPSEVAQAQADAESKEVDQEEVVAEKEHTATETVTEAEETKTLARVFTRPKRRPSRTATASERELTEPEQAEEQNQAALKDQPKEPEPTASPVEDEQQSVDINALVARAVDEQQQSMGTRTSGLNEDERNGLRRAIQECWNVGTLSEDAQMVVVTVAFELSQSGKPLKQTIRMISATGGDAASENKAYEAGRRAILRCLSEGHELPADKYESWRSVEVVFNPKEMRLR